MSKPVIASDVGDISEIVRNGENGFALQNQAVLFAEKIKLLLGDKDLYSSFCQTSFKTYKNELTVNKWLMNI